MTARKKYDIEKVKRAALSELSNKPVADWIETALNYTAIRQKLMSGGASEARLWGSSRSSVVTAVETAYKGALRSRRTSIAQPQKWLAAELAVIFELADLNLRTNSAASAPIEELLKRFESEDLSWPIGISEAAQQVFLNALDAVDEHSGLRRVDILPFRSAENTDDVKIPITDLRQTRMVDQVKGYHDLWRRLLERYGRTLADPADRAIRDVLSLLGALEDGFLAQAAGTSPETRERHAKSFALGTTAILERLTRAVGPER